MIHGLILELLIVIIHCRSLSLAVHFKYNIMHVILKTCSSVIIANIFFLIPIKPVDPVLFCLTKDLACIKFQFSKKDFFSTCNVSHKDLSMRGTGCIEFTIIRNLRLPSSIKLLFWTRSLGRCQIMNLLILCFQFKLKIWPILGKREFFSMKRFIGISSSHWAHLDSKVIFFNELVCRLIINSCHWRYTSQFKFVTVSFMFGRLFAILASSINTIIFMQIRSMLRGIVATVLPSHPSGTTHQLICTPSITKESIILHVSFLRCLHLFKQLLSMMCLKFPVILH